ncbi:hypothetical protein Cgig2_030050 [Carnegiea gigantea]|uniref:Uncharacterized protein n=1 Tax=Carnegiea gigantea TaxID=171969 RepID=A0A9Q1K193_9CARY|nr:hypothetical protein Cgig2_030050 [Carnegiea gigantea]
MVELWMPKWNFGSEMVGNGRMEWRSVCTMELRKHQRYIGNEATPFSDLSSISDDDESAFNAMKKDMDNSPNSYSGDLVTPELRSKKLHDKGGSREAHARTPKNRGDVAVTELRCSTKSENVEGKGKGLKGSKGKSVEIEGKVVENEGEGIGDVFFRHWYTLEVVCSLNFELEDFQKLAIKETVWSPILMYEPFVMDKRLTRASKIGWRKLPFSVYDVTLVTGLPATGKHATFERGQGAYGVEEVVKAAIDDHLTRERTSFLVKEKIPLKKNLQMHGFAMIIQVWFYEHTNLYPHTDDKCVSRIASWVNMYIGRKYDAAELISSIKDNQGIISIEKCLQRTRKALRIEKEAHATTK